ncbi:MAG: MBL fold metallo-hydrolase [Pleomorphochaeta sp.]
MKNLEITTLVENSKGEHLSLINEHGISFFIEIDGECILFDVGQTDAFIKNSILINKNLSKVNHVVLSHGHYDHSGGLKYLVDINKDFNLWLGKGFFNEKYGYQNGAYEYLGNDFDEKYLINNNLKFKYVNQDIVEIVKDVFIITNFEKTQKDEKINPRFVLRKDEQFVKDEFLDEVLIAIKTDKGIIAILGCSHPGMRNMLETAKRRLNAPLYAVLGGTHLVEADQECFNNSINYLSSGNIQYVGVSHCTGLNAMKEMSKSNSHYFHNRTGTSLIFNN